MFEILKILFTGLKVSDTGNYTCRAVSETGETTREAILYVEGKNFTCLVHVPAFFKTSLLLSA